MQTILATGFGCQVDILNGEANELTSAAAGVFNSFGISPVFQLFCKYFNCSISLLSRVSTYHIKVSQKFLKVCLCLNRKNVNNIDHKGCINISKKTVSETWKENILA